MAKNGSKDVQLMPARQQRALRRQAAMDSRTGRRNRNKPHCVSLCDPDAIDPTRFDVNSPNVQEMITQPLYDRQLYPAAGSASLSFFQTPVGQGTRTYEDTNMELAGQLPAPQSFLITGISINWWPGTTQGIPLEVGTDTNLAAGAVNDMFSVFRRGELELNIGSKNYGRFAALDMLPPRSHLAANLALASPAATEVDSFAAQIPFIEGDVFKINPIRLTASQNFKVSVNFPGGAVALPSTDALAYMGIVLWGTLFRAVQ